jgi:hypothetical protein
LIEAAKDGTPVKWKNARIDSLFECQTVCALREAAKCASEFFRKINSQGKIAVWIQFEELMIEQVRPCAFGQD